MLQRRRDAAALAAWPVSEALARQQATLVEALNANRVPDGFDPRGVRATAAILARKKHKLAVAEAQRRSRRSRTIRWVRQLLAWRTSS